MHFLYEEGGEIKAATLLGDASINADSWQVETPHGKRIKLRAKDVWMQFKEPNASDLLEEANRLAGEVDMDLLWECSPDTEFKYDHVAREYFGDSVASVQLAALAIALQAAPIYFRRKGRGNFQRAPEDQLNAAKAAVERKKNEAIIQAGWEAQLIAGELPDELKTMGVQLLLSPDKNGIAYKALAGAAQTLGLSNAALLVKVGAIASTLAVHQTKFLKEHFPKGVQFPADTHVSQSHWQAISAELPVAEVNAFSIDDAMTTEIDDAFSVTKLSEDRYQVGVHIAAPGLLIKRDDALDAIARKRLSTVYFPGGKVTMLPQEVISIFSLAANNGDINVPDAASSALVARPALSLYVYINSNGELLAENENAPITKVECVPIAANLRLHELEGIDEESLNADSVSDSYPFKKELALLWRAAKNFHAQRQEKRVSFGQRPEKLGSPDPLALLKDFNFDLMNEAGEVFQSELSEQVTQDVAKWQVGISARARGSVIDTIVAEWMIYCNSTWGSMLAAHDVPAIYRAQQGWGAQRTRMQTSPCRHEGLGVENYAWCTSPLRRYSDLVNQWQLIAMAQNGVTAKLVAPFAPKDSQLMAIAADFDATYGAYGEHQTILEKYWCLRWLAQQGLPWKGMARTLKEGNVRLEEIPLRIFVPELSTQPRGVRVELEIVQTDLLELSASARVIKIYQDQVDSLQELEDEENPMSPTSSQPSLNESIDESPKTDGA